MMFMLMFFVCFCAKRNNPAFLSGAEETSVTITDTAEAMKAIGRVIQFEGMAQNAKISAVIVNNDLILYCLDKNNWSKEITGRKVRVQGILEYSSEFKAQKSSKGVVSQGTGGNVFLLRKSDQVDPLNIGVRH